MFAFHRIEQVRLQGLHSPEIMGRNNLEEIDYMVRVLVRKGKAVESLGPLERKNREKGTGLIFEGTTKSWIPAFSL